VFDRSVGIKVAGAKVALARLSRRGYGYALVAHVAWNLSGLTMSILAIAIRRRGITAIHEEKLDAEIHLPSVRRRIPGTAAGITRNAGRD
jgi:hypothetical protein